MPYEVSNGAQEGFLSGVQSADRWHTAQLEDYGKMRNDYFSTLNARLAALAHVNAKPTEIGTAADDAKNMLTPYLNYNPSDKTKPAFRQNVLQKTNQVETGRIPFGAIQDPNSPANRTAYAPNPAVQNGTVVATPQYAANARNTLSNIQNLVAAVTNAAQGIRQQQANGQPIHPQAMDNYNKLVNALGYVRNMPNGNSSGRG
jgi:hypothetical protein